jgi:hypothetical protein
MEIVTMHLADWAKEMMNHITPIVPQFDYVRANLDGQSIDETEMDKLIDGFQSLGYTVDRSQPKVVAIASINDPKVGIFFDTTDQDDDGIIFIHWYNEHELDARL